MQKRMNDLTFRLMSLEFQIKARFANIRDLLEEQGVVPGMVLLDFGCGPGRYTIPAARIVGPTGRVYAADLHPLGLRAVERASRRSTLTNVETILTDGVLPLDDRSIDFALLYDTLHDVEKPDQVVGELLRVLKPNGVLSFRDHHLDPETTFGPYVESGALRMDRARGGITSYCRRPIRSEA